jgi:hypothetical protein
MFIEVAYLLDVSVNIGISPWSRVPFENLIVTQLDRELVGFYLSRMFITDLKRAFHLTLS